MPTYEYECRDCGHVFELIQKMTDQPRKRCPKCRGKVARKLGVGAGVIFKGSGFYQTDYRSEEYRKREKAESTPPGEPSDKGAGTNTPAEKKQSRDGVQGVSGGSKAGAKSGNQKG